MRLDKFIHIMQTGNCKPKCNDVNLIAYNINWTVKQMWIDKSERNWIYCFTIRSTITNNQVSLATIKVSNDLHKFHRKKVTLRFVTTNSPQNALRKNMKRLQDLKGREKGCLSREQLTSTSVGWRILTTSAVRALVMSPWTWITPSIGAIGCKSMATIRGRSLSLQVMIRFNNIGIHIITVYRIMLED